MLDSSLTIEVEKRKTKKKCGESRCNIDDDIMYVVSPPVRNKITSITQKNEPFIQKMYLKQPS